jgi:hypothetical protein
MNVRSLMLACALAACVPCAFAQEPPAATPPPAPAAAEQPPAQREAPPPRAGALQLETTQITGNRELPKVMVIVPWKDAEPAALPGRPINSLVEEVLTPVDRDVMRRTLDYYRLLAETPATSSGTPAASDAAGSEPDSEDQ